MIGMIVAAQAQKQDSSYYFVSWMYHASLCQISAANAIISVPSDQTEKEIMISVVAKNKAFYVIDLIKVDKIAYDDFVAKNVDYSGEDLGAAPVTRTAETPFMYRIEYIVFTGETFSGQGWCNVVLSKDFVPVLGIQKRLKTQKTIITSYKKVD